MAEGLTMAVFVPKLGSILLAIVLGTSVFTILIGAWAGMTRNDLKLKMAERAVYGTTALITICIALLWVCLLTDNFLVRYVYNYSNRDMPILYKIAALWGGQDGSLLLWLWLSSLFATFSVWAHRKADRDLLPYAIATFGAILSFFALLVVYSDNPFRLFPEAPMDGKGLNPLLQNPSMAIHPPCLYLGYVGMSVPFAFAMSALIANRLDSRWIISTRIWTLIAWFFLSVGNLLGAHWAYKELGWGGFWGWDPVENAAIMPWFTASAFLHSVMIQERRGMLKFWNMNLIVLSFCLTILGTYLTRSGVVQSVHSFARSSIGYYFLGFLAIVILFSGFWIWKRRKELRSENIFESILSKESAFVLNNIALVGSGLIILLCTMYPSASELISGRRILVGPPFFNKMLCIPALFLLILTGIGPMIGWKKASSTNLRNSFTWPIIVGLVTMGCLALLQLTDWYVLVTGFGASFVLTTLVMEFYKGTHARMTQYKEPWPLALLSATLKSNRKYGGYIVHLGLVFIFVGIAGAAYKRVMEFDMAPGDVVSFADYHVRFQKFEQRDSPNQEELRAVLDLYIDEEKVDTVRPGRFFYKQPEQPSTEVDIYTRWNEDVYFTLGSIDPETQKAKIHITLNPMMFWLWFGGFVLVAGAMISMSPPISFRALRGRRK